MKYILLITLILIIGIYFYKKQYQFKTKDYSSNMLQNRTVFKSLCGFSFNKKDVSKQQIKHDVKILKNVLKNAVSMNKEKKLWLKKLIKCIEKKKISFENFNYDIAINLINLSLDDIADLVLINKSEILRKIFPFRKKPFITSTEKIEFAQLHGINEEELKEWFAEINARYFISNDFIDDEQYKILDTILCNSKINNEKDINTLSKKLSEILNEEQKEILKKHYITFEILSKNILFYGKNCLYRFTKLKKILPDYFFDNENREPLIKLLNGTDAIDPDNFSIKHNVNLKIDNEKFIPTVQNDKNFSNIVKKISFIEVFKDHDQILDALRNAEKRYIKIPKILVNFDLKSDIYINKTIEYQNIANWINIAIKRYNINDIYWVVPNLAIYNNSCFNYFFGENTEDSFDFNGNLNINRTYKDLKKPLKHSILYDLNTEVISTQSIYFSKKEINSYLKTGRYKIINIYTCISKNLPNINKDFILSIDGNYFNNCGFDSNIFLEHIDFNPNMIFNEFLEIYIKKLKKASVIGLSISPKVIGFDSLASTRGFYEYFLNKIKEKRVIY